VYAVYNFGTDLLVDHATKTCYPLGDTLAEYYDELDASLTGAKG
jgi:hypothetical protein